MRTNLRFVVAAACLSLLARPAFGQDKPKLLEINGFMFKGVFTELDPEQMNAGCPWPRSKSSISTEIQRPSTIS